MLSKNKSISCTIIINYVVNTGFIWKTHLETLMCKTLKMYF